MRCPFTRVIQKDGIIREIPCGKCEICKDNRRRDYTVRLNLAKKQFLNHYFITLTFNEDELPTDRDGCIRKFQLYMKRLRKNINSRGVFKYFCVLEKGEIGGRYHWHQILFTNLKFSKEELRNVILDNWHYGIVDVGYLQEGGITYVCKYLFKEDYKMLISRGLGFPDFDEKSLDNLVNGYNINGYHYTVNQSIVNKLSRTNRELFHYYQEKRAELFKKRLADIITGKEKEESVEESHNRYIRYVIDKYSKK